MPTTVGLAVQRAATLVAPDDRVDPFSIECGMDGETVVLSGIVADQRAARTVADEVERAAGDLSVRNQLAVLIGSGDRRTTDRRVAPVRDAPDADGEQVSQALYGTDLVAYDRQGAWRRVRTPGGYLGWIDEDALVGVGGRTDPDERAVGADERSRDWSPDATIASACGAPDGSDGVPGRLPPGTTCRFESTDGTDATVSFRTGATATLPVERLRRRRPVGDGTTVIDVASQFLGTTYEWGGMTADGVDCSGLVWIAYAVAGVHLPRDADQQETLGAAVDRDALAPGDLLFWPGHVAISLGDAAYVHAYGDADGVTIGSLDPDDDRYVADLDERLRSTKRLLDPDRAHEPSGGRPEAGGERR